MDRTSADYELLRHEGGAFSLHDYTLVEFSGSDWREWLQGQITNDIRSLSPENPISFCLCKPTGQILAPGDLHDVNGNGWMIVPSSTISSVMQRVEQMVILEDCEAKVIETPITHVLFGEEGLRSKRSLWDGRDVVGEFNGPTVDSGVLQFLSMEACYPLWGLDIDESNFPAEMGERFEHRNMSYTKGCYTGQEVNHRIHSRGHTNKTWAVYLSESEFKKGADILDETGQKVGTATRSIYHEEHGWMVGAFIRNEATPVLPRYTP